MRRERRGFSLMLVMVAISLSLVLTYAFVRSQATAMQIAENSRSRDRALQAAQSGASAALRQMQSMSWEGVESELTGIAFSDEEGTGRYEVNYRPAASAKERNRPDESILTVVIVSTGIWMSEEHPERQVKRQVEVTARLQPRLPGRKIGPKDSAEAEDLAENPGNYDRIQHYALFAARGATSLVVDPGSRIDGGIWAYGGIQLFEEPYWSSRVRREVLESIGGEYVSDSSELLGVNLDPVLELVLGEDEDLLIPEHPHPIRGPIVFYSSPSSRLQNDLERLNVPWTQTGERLDLPAVDFSRWRRYRLYEGGFEYRAEQVDSTLQDVELRPSRENPLGIFYRQGSIVLKEDVILQGTLVSTGTVSFQGRRIQLSGFNWRGRNGGSLFQDSDQWPRVPAIVADRVEFDRDVQTRVDGAIVVRDQMNGAGGVFEQVEANRVSLMGTATSRSIEQPLSIVRLQELRDLSGLSAEGEYSIWLEKGNTGGWYPIVGIDESQQELKVVGEVGSEEPIEYRIERTRKQFVDLQGPVAGETYDIDHLPTWELTESIWNDLLHLWKEEEGLLQLQDPPPFVEWLADPSNFAGWPYPYSEYGLDLEPTFHLRNTLEVDYRWSPPLFRAYQGSVDDQEFAGYRWKVISWRELPVIRDGS